MYEGTSPILHLLVAILCAAYAVLFGTVGNWNLATPGVLLSLANILIAWDKATARRRRRLREKLDAEWLEAAQRNNFLSDHEFRNVRK